MKLLVIIAVILLLLFVFIRFLEQKNLYFPFRDIEMTPEDISLQYEDINLKSGDGTGLHGWFVPSGTSRATILLAHGNGGNISHRLEKIKMLNGLGLDILIFDYRGYGLSGGSPSEKGFYLDVMAFYDFLVNEKKISADKIIGYGESLGGAVIIDLARRRYTGGLIIEGTFTSVPDMARKLVPFVPTSILKTGFDSLKKVRDIEVPKLFFHSTDDEVIPFELGQKLFNAAPEPKEFARLQGGHNDAFVVSGDEYLSRIDGFVNRIIN